MDLLVRLKPSEREPGHRHAHMRAHPHEEVCRSAPWKNMGPRNRHCRAVDVRSELGCHENVRVFAVEHYIDRSEHDLGSCDSQVPLKYLVVFCALSV